MGVQVIENEAIRVTVADKGAELISVVDRASGKERIWCGDPAVWNRHAPILFPFIGKSAGGAYRYEGKTYAMGQHGFARDREMTCVSHSGTAVTYRLEADAETKKVYPFDFELFVTHELDRENPRLLHVYWEIRNAGASVMYYSIGGHPGFAVPAEEGETREDYYLEFPGQERLPYIMVNLANGLAVTGTTYELELEDGRVPIAKDMFDRDALIFENHVVKTVRIDRPDRTPYVTMYCEEIPNLGIWSKPNGPFVCLEPWVGRADDDGFTGELPEKTGVQKLEAGESRRIHYSMEFHA